MGGGTSAASGRLPTEAIAANLSVEEGALTRQMLDSLARRNISPGKRRSSSSSKLMLKQFRSSTIPKSVSDLLKRIGVEDVDNESNRHEHKSKLVNHIFECLGALQSLVNAADLTYPDEDFETQSVVERDEKAMGTLLHEMVFTVVYFIQSRSDNFILC
jgi:hypothetical protein